MDTPSHQFYLSTGFWSPVRGRGRTRTFTDRRGPAGHSGHLAERAAKQRWRCRSDRFPGGARRQAPFWPCDPCDPVPRVRRRSSSSRCWRLRSCARTSVSNVRCDRRPLGSAPMSWPGSARAPSHWGPGPDDRRHRLGGGLLRSPSAEPEASHPSQRVERVRLSGAFKGTGMRPIPRRRA